MGMKRAIIDIKNEYHDSGFYITAKYVIYRAIKHARFLLLGKFCKNVGHKFVNPTLDELYQVVDLQTNDFSILLQKFHIDEYDSEFQEALKVFNEIKNKTTLNYPKNFEVNGPEAKFLYGITRRLKPKIFIETGVADGVSSFFILNAIKKNKTGKLISIDVRNNVGNFVPEGLKKSWELKILRGNFVNDFKNIMSKSPRVDIFLHDSDHSYEWQTLEYKAALNKLVKNGLLLSDDVDKSYALIDLIKANPNKYKVFTMVTDRKAFGVIMNR
ncbi:MAG: class I SAM-dependent methyltransferase [Candidatus Micrarchaeia archaeon]